nr:MAG TPA: hypothetical protein [Inoviridae sp.]
MDLPLLFPLFLPHLRRHLPPRFCRGFIFCRRRGRAGR